jgi:hypothetical protein
MNSVSLPIRISSPKVEGLLQVSKWLKVQVLLDEDEMKDLLQCLQFPFFVVVSEPVTAEEAVISSEEFLKKYAEYVQILKEGKIPPTEEFRRFFSCAIASSLESFYAIPVKEKFLIKPIKPVLQLQAHHFFYSDLDGKFHPMVLSPDSISWGLQISYPQMAQDLQTRQIAKVADTPEYPNTALFTKLMKWMRGSTLPTPFEVKGARTNSPIRVGKKSLSWIKKHPQLQQKGLCVHCI